MAASAVPFSSDVGKAKEIAKAFQAGDFGVEPSYGVPYGYAIAMIWEELLKKACEAGTLAR